ncbi:DUF4174 domain-containing protein [Anianabacter salinae]|uniref:DUF4174 domain-containing protein n=1 Tax=Anianabacter salinae TaxID=2851023 RepID=UPI00225E574D|nr:DUF4174 domain-containing protein [Anianabacter salinae]MBV0913925.1 DUF4174 domain-containing protein [Anianabacter salinae]
MKSFLILGFTVFFATVAAAQGAEVAEDPDAWNIGPFEAGEIDLDDFKWIARPVVVFADTPADPRFREQLQYLAERPEALVDRDVVILTDTDPEAQSALRTRLRPRGFSLVVLAKDGTVNLRKPFPWNVRELSRAIDKMPLRQEEMRDANRPGG